MTKPQQLTVLFGLAAAAVYFLAVEPAERDLETLRTKLGETESERGRVVRTMMGAEAALNRLVKARVAFSNECATLVSPLLGSYAMRMKSQVDSLARGAGLSSTDYLELSPLALPLPAGALPKQLYARVPVEFTAVGSYQEAVSFLVQLERDFPNAALQSLEIAATTVPELQRIKMVVEWPALGASTVTATKTGGAR